MVASGARPGEGEASRLVARAELQHVRRRPCQSGQHVRRGQQFRRRQHVRRRLGPPGGGGSALRGVTSIYVVHLPIARPGRYWLVAEPAGAKIQALGELDVKARSDSVAVGAKAPPSATPTLASTHGAVSELTTRVPPDRALLR